MHSNIFFFINVTCSILIALVASLGAVNLIYIPEEYHLEICTVTGLSSVSTNLTFILKTVNGPAILTDSVPVIAGISVGAPVPCIVTWYGLAGIYDPPYHIAVLGHIYVKIPTNVTYYIIVGVFSFITFVLEIAHWIWCLKMGHLHEIFVF